MKFGLILVRQLQIFVQYCVESVDYCNWYHQVMETKLGRLTEIADMLCKREEIIKIYYIRIVGKTF